MISFERKLREVGEERYHHRHPFHLKMHEGSLSKTQLQAWALNRFYYQNIIPKKDALILAKSDDPVFRREWRKRIVDHDGEDTEINAGIERWLRLAEATGLDRRRVASTREVLPAVRFAVDAYLELVRSGTLLEAVASSLTELFSSQLIATRLSSLRKSYAWLDRENRLEYFEARLSQAPRDVEFALDWVIGHARTAEEQELAIQALRRKCDILWAQLDALYFSYVQPGWAPHGAFVGEVAGKFDGVAA